MAQVEESVHVMASLAETWDAYFDQRGWGTWVDSFQSVLEADGYPEAGGTLRWRSVVAGRGDVTEKVLEHSRRRHHRIAFSDPTLEGEMSTTFAIEGEGTRVVIGFEYSLVERGPFAWMASLLFVKGQIKGTIQRSLAAFKLEAEERATLGLH